jgi:AraC-like DNA-binding protein
MTLAQLRAMAPPGYLAVPHRPTFHLLILTTAGAATHIVDFRPYELASGRTVWVRPGQVQFFSDGDSRPAGDLVLFQPDFLIPNTQAEAIADNRFGHVAYSHTPEVRASIDRARRALRQEYAIAATARQATATQTETLRHLLSILILRLSHDAPEAHQTPNNLYVGFRDLLERDFAIAHDVTHYAQALGYSSRTLARATHTATGQTPKQAIQDRLTLEARRLLAHTNLPISTISTQLGFHDPSNFATFFTHHTGDTPTAFRDQQRPTRNPPATTPQTEHHLNERGDADTHPRRTTAPVRKDQQAGQQMIRRDPARTPLQT